VRAPVGVVLLVVDLADGWTVVYQSGEDERW